MLFSVLWAVWSHHVVASETVTTGDQYPPYVDSNLKDNGLMVPVITEILDNTTEYFDFEMVYQPWVRGYEQAKQGMHLGTFPYVWDEDRDKDFLYSDIIYDISSHLFVKLGPDETTLVDKHWSVELLNERSLRKVCRPNGYSIKEIDDSFLSKGDFELIQPSDLNDCFRLLAKGRVDIIPIDATTGLFVAAELGMEDQIGYFENAIHKAGLHFIVSKEREDAAILMEQFNESLRALKSKGRLQEVRASFLKDYGQELE